MLQKKLIRPGEGARITTQVFRGGWRGYQGHTLVVRLPNSRSDTFRVADVVTEGIQGQPQLTFDSRDAAIAWKESHPQYADWNIGRVNREYMCIKIPLEDGSEAWLAESNFPDEGSPEWDRLLRLYPDYFRTGPGFFIESINRNFTSDDEIEQIMTSDISEEEKCRRLFDRDLQRVLRYGVFSFIQTGEAFEATSEKRREAQAKCTESHHRNNIFVSTLLVLGNMSEPFNLTESFNFYVQGQYSDKYRKHPSDRINPLNWWRYIKDVVEAWEEALGTEPHKLGFFNETLYQNSIRLKIEEGDEFITNKSDVIMKLNQAGAHFWLGDYTKYKITNITLQDGNLLCSGDYWNLDEDDDNVLWRGSWDESDNITVEDIEGQINIPGAIIEFNGKEVAKQKLGFFSEELSLTESYNVPHDTIKRVVIKYVKDNGYIRGDWNGRYPTESPTVYEINKLLRYEEDLEPYECTPEQFEQMNTWVSHVQPEGPQAEWMRGCIESWNKQSDLNKDDLKNMVSFVSYKFSNDAYNRRQELKRQRDLEHQQHVESERNTWAGEIGDKISFVVQEPKSFGTAYGTMWNCIGTDGRTYTFGYQEEVQRGYTVSGKVTKLNEFRGIKQTHLTRVNVEPTHLGFF